MNKKKLISSVLCFSLLLGVSACSSKETETTAVVTTTETTTEATTEATTTVNWPVDIYVYSVTDTVTIAIENYTASHPEFAEHYNVIATTVRSDEYYETVGTALSNNSVDLYIVEDVLYDDFVNGEYSEYAASYNDLFTDYDSLVSTADVAQYAIDLGTRSSDGAVVGISYDANQGLMMYRRSIATEVFGTDDPSEIEKIFGAETGNFDLFLAAAETLKNSGYVTTSSLYDMTSGFRCMEHAPYMVNGTFAYSTDMEYQLDVERQMVENGYTNNTDSWSSAWMDDMSGSGAHKVFCYLAPYWQLNSTNGPLCGETAGDWAVCKPPVNFYTIGSLVMANKSVIGTPKEDGIREIINHLIFDTSNDGFQYQYATSVGQEAEDVVGFPVVSREVMRNVSGTLPITGEQDIYEVICSMDNFSISAPSSQCDDMIWSEWNRICTSYANGECTREEAIEQLPIMLDMYGVPV